MLLFFQAKAKEKSYDFRGDAFRGIQVSYPVPEPVLTPRAREGLRTVVPTIFPPSAINRGESVHIRSLEPERRYKPTVQHPPKKRGRKPKQNLRYDDEDDDDDDEEDDDDDGGTSAEPYAKRSRAAEEPESRRLNPHRGTPDHGLIQLTRRFREETTITPKPYSDQRRVGGAGLTYSCVISPDVRSRDEGAHRTGRVGASDPQLRQPRHSDDLQAHRRECLPGAFGLAAGAEADLEPSWTPRFSNLDAVTVTDVTVNLLTVTVKESSSDQGFFRQKR